MGAVAAFIPAKMTSQRLPAKNMRHLGGRPLLYYSVRAAQLTEGIDRVVVSSEDREVLHYAAGIGAEALQRDAALASPEVRNIDVLRAWLETTAELPELVVLLQPTHPFRLPSDLAAAVREMTDEPQADSLLALAPHNHLVGTLAGGYFTSEAALSGAKAAGQQLYRNTGAFYILRSRTTIRAGTLLGQRIRGYRLPHPEIEVDVDREADLLYAEAILKANSAMLAHFS